jgi:hypothetical protein
MRTYKTDDKTVVELKELTLDCDGEDMFIIADGVKIAKRGRGRYANTWISLEPGYIVRDRGYPTPKGIEVEYNGELITLH